jgi:formylglycine-generating enzyme required for sulfatase activity
VLDRYCVGCHDGRERPDKKTLPDLRRAEPRSMPLSPFPFPPSFYELRRLVRSPGLEGPSVIPVGDYHADTNELVQMLRKGHHNVRLDDEAWDRLATWLDMNAPAYGTWLEIPTVRNRQHYLQNPAAFFSAGLRPSPVSEIEHFRQRRIDLLRRYGGATDDPEVVPSPPTSPVSPVMPPPETPVEAVRVAGWPFAAQEAKQRQANSAASTANEIDLGAGVKLELVLVPPGEFVLGDPAGYPDERPLCRTKIDRPFWMGKLEVTNQQYALFDSGHESGTEPMLWLKWHPGHLPPLSEPRQPVCRVSWNEARGFCQWLSQKTGRKFSLPTEAQWEWACRAGAETALSFGPLGTDASPFANLADASLLNLGKLAAMEKVQPFFPVDPVDDKQTVSAPVGAYRPNPWGLHDLHGNAAEWTASAYLPYPFRADDPRHAAGDTRKTVRGGSWRERADWARSGCRTSYWPWQRVFNVGFRVVCELE